MNFNKMVPASGIRVWAKVEREDEPAEYYPVVAYAVDDIETDLLVPAILLGDDTMSLEELRSGYGVIRVTVIWELPPPVVVQAAPTSYARNSAITGNFR